LRAQALVPLQVQPLSSPAANERKFLWSGGAFSRGVFTAAGLAIWTRQLAGLITSGLPLERALTALTDEAENDRERHLVAALRAEVNAGSSFAKALARFPREFPDIFTAVVGAGEQSGNLGLVLERLADDLEERQALQAKLIGAALYPAIVTVLRSPSCCSWYVRPGRERVCRQQARAALPHRRHARDQGLVRSWGWLAACSWRPERWPPGWPCAAQPPGNA
jgi:general secretion pathway protein F